MEIYLSLAIVCVSAVVYLLPINTKIRDLARLSFAIALAAYLLHQTKVIQIH